MVGRRFKALDKNGKLIGYIRATHAGRAWMLALELWPDAESVQLA